MQWYFIKHCQNSFELNIFSYEIFIEDLFISVNFFFVKIFTFLEKMWIACVFLLPKIIM